MLSIKLGDCCKQTESAERSSGLLFLRGPQLIYLVPDVSFSVSWDGKKTSGNGGQLTDRAAPIGFK